MDLTLYGIPIWAGMLVFARIGAMVMLMPGFGEPAIPSNVRLAFALLLAAVLAPTLAGRIAAPPASAWGMAGVVASETIIGVILGGTARLLVSSLATAGQAMGLELGLSFAQTADPTMTQSGQILAVFLSLMGVALIFATGLDHMFIAGIVGSYDLIAPGAPPTGPRHGLEFIPRRLPDRRAGDRGRAGVSRGAGRAVAAHPANPGVLRGAAAAGDGRLRGDRAGLVRRHAGVARQLAALRDMAALTHG